MGSLPLQRERILVEDLLHDPLLVEELIRAEREAELLDEPEEVGLLAARMLKGAAAVDLARTFVSVSSAISITICAWAHDGRVQVGVVVVVDVVVGIVIDILNVVVVTIISGNRHLWSQSRPQNV